MSQPNLKKRSSEPAFRVRQPSQQILRSKIKVLEEQVQTLQSGMNILAEVKQKSGLEQVVSKSLAKCDHGRIIQDLKSKVAKLEHRNRMLVQEKKILESKLEETKKELERANRQIENLSLVNQELVKQNKQKDEKIFALELQLKYSQQQNQQIKKQLRLLKQDHLALKQRIQSIENHSLVDLALKTALIILKVQNYKQMRDQIYQLKKKISELELEKQWSKDDQEFSKKREIVMDRYQRSNIGEQIVRLKKNIDRGIGDGQSQYTQTFLNKFKEIQKTLNQLSR